MKYKKLFSKYGCRCSQFILKEVTRVRIVVHTDPCRKKKCGQTGEIRFFLQPIYNHFSSTPSSAQIHSLLDVFSLLFGVIIAIKTDIIKEHQNLAEGGPVSRQNLHSYYYAVMLSVPQEVQRRKCSVA